MTTYVYAVCDEKCHNQVKTVSARSQKDAHEKIIEHYRDSLELDEEFDNWFEFLDFMADHDIFITPTVQDLETL